jgi:gluconokinase
MLQAIDQTHSVPVHYAPLPTPPASTTASPTTSSGNLSKTTEMTIPHRHHILIVTGPAGCGKSTIAKVLSDRYGFEYIEGDEVRLECWGPLYPLLIIRSTTQRPTLTRWLPAFH